MFLLRETHGSGIYPHLSSIKYDRCLLIDILVPRGFYSTVYAVFSARRVHSSVSVKLLMINPSYRPWEGAQQLMETFPFFPEGPGPFDVYSEDMPIDPLHRLLDELTKPLPGDQL
jgi:hypothetical protein